MYCRIGTKVELVSVYEHIKNVMCVIGVKRELHAKIKIFDKLLCTLLFQAFKTSKNKHETPRGKMFVIINITLRQQKPCIFKLVTTLIDVHCFLRDYTENKRNEPTKLQV